MKKGRHKLPIKTLKIYQVKARFSEDDYALVIKKAKQAGLKPAVYAARTATSTIIKEPLTKEELADIKGLLRIGVNLNQIAKKINSNQHYSCQEQLMCEIGNLAILRKELFNKLASDNICE